MRNRKRKTVCLTASVDLDRRTRSVSLFTNPTQPPTDIYRMRIDDEHLFSELRRRQRKKEVFHTTVKNPIEENAICLEYPGERAGGM